MKRVLAVVLLGALVLQSGAVLAATQTSSEITPLHAELAVAFANAAQTMHQYFLATRLGAELAGGAQLDRYDAAHAPAPTPPPRGRTLTPSLDARSHLVPGTPVHGQRLAGPPMLSHVPTLSEFQQLRKHPAPQSTPNVLLRSGTLSVKTVTAATASRTTTSALAVRPLTVNVSSPPTTGWTSWWTFQSGNIPGVGTWSTNVATGNGLIEIDDLDIPERGLDLVFKRFYNTQSQHTYGNADGSTPADYGEQWTNNFDAHIAQNSSGGLSIYDTTGYRIDYTLSSGVYVPPPGQYGQLVSDGSCGYLWTQKDGSILYFYRPDMQNCGNPQLAGYDGRLYQIIAPNHNNYIQLNYSWIGGNATTAANLAQINAVHSDGQQLVLTFANFSGYEELSYVTRPDGASITYGYDTAGHLGAVYQLANNSTGTVPFYGIGYNSGSLTPTGILDSIGSPRWYNSGSTQGSYTWWSCDSSDRITSVQVYGIANFAPADGTSTLLQPSLPSGGQQISLGSFGYSTGSTSFSDTDGHSASWSYDSSNRVTQEKNWTGGSNWLVTNAQWDASNNLIAAIDTRGYETDVAYDNTGNPIAIALPSVTTSAGTFRPTRLLSYDSYNNVTAACDAVFANAHGLNWTSRPAPSDTLCPSTSGATYFTYNYSDAAQPYGQLSTSYTPLGYERQYAYSTSAQGGDYGLLTSVQGASITQADSTNITPLTEMIYDGYGNAVCSSSLQNSGGTHWSRFAYDGLNRQTSASDPDDASLSVSACANTPGIPGSYIVSTTSYYPDGSVATTQNPSEHQGNVTTSHVYDLDGDETSTSTNYGCVPGQSCSQGVTQRWYDGEDRLVEVVEPTNAPIGTTSADTFPWMTRYLYDLTQGSTVTMTYDSTAYKAYGNLYKTQRYLPGPSITYTTSGGISPQVTTPQNPSVSASPTPAPTPNISLQQPPNTAVTWNQKAQLAQQNLAKQAAPNMPGTYQAPSSSQPVQLTSTASGQAVPAALPAGSWTDVRGTTYDPVNRQTVDLRYAPATNTVVNHTYTYDTGAAGLLVSETTAVSDTKAYAYDADGNLSSITFTVGSSSTATPNRTYTYDPDARIASIGNAQFGTWNYAYNADGKLSTLTEPAAGGSGISGYPYTNSGKLTSPGTYTLSYYGNDMLSGEQVAGSNPFSRTLSYRQDGVPTTAWFSQGGTITRAYTSGGRLTSRTDPVTNEPFTYDGYGRLSSETTPLFSFSSITYDDEGEPASYYSQWPPPYVSGTDTVTYTATGEDATTGFITWNETTPYFYFDGVPLANSEIVDTRNLMQTGYASSSPSYPSWSDTLDNAGRVHSSGAEQISVLGRLVWVGPYHEFSYDAEDHLTYSYDTTVGDNHYYAWGPNGHPVTMGTQKIGTGNPWLYQALHWDNSMLAYETRTNATVDDYKIGLDGDVLPGNSVYAGATYWDYSLQQSNIDGHNADSNTYPTFWDSSAGYIPIYNRPDSVTDFTAFFQGVRNYNSDTSQWSSSDQSAGSIDDPMSQAGYIWNNNNPFMYQDPTGFVSESCGGDTDPDDTLSQACSGSGTATLYPYPFPFSVPQVPAIRVVAGSSFIPAVKDANPCRKAANAPSPSQYQSRAQADAMIPGPGTADLLNFIGGRSLDAQVLYKGSPGYANYVYGDFMSAYGMPLFLALSAANAYAHSSSIYGEGTVYDSTYTHTPAVNVLNIISGYYAQNTGTLCNATTRPWK